MGSINLDTCISDTYRSILLYRDRYAIGGHIPLVC